MTNWGKQNVEVYTTMGVHVTSFGQYGKNRGEFRHPYGVHVDKDGFLYICDCNNNRLQVF